MTPSQVIELLTAAVSVAEALERSGALDAKAQVIAILDEHPAVIAARARVEDALDAKFPVADGSVEK